MALANKLTVTFEWENNVGFQMKSKLNDEAVLTIQSMDENGHIRELWHHTQEACSDYIVIKLAQIGKEMKES